MAKETQRATPANVQRIRAVSASPPHSSRPASRSPSIYCEEHGPRIPAPPPHLVAHRSHYDRAAERYARTQAMAGNYSSRKPVGVSSTRQESPRQVDIPSSPPLPTVRAIPSTVPGDCPLNCDTHDPNATTNDLTPDKPSQSSHRFSGYPQEPTHHFQLFPTPVYPPRSFAFKFDPLATNNPAQFHYAITKAEEQEQEQEQDRHPTDRPQRASSSREICPTELAIAYSAASSTRPVVGGDNPQTWEVKERRARVFAFERGVRFHHSLSYDRSYDRCDQSREQSVDAHEMRDGDEQEQEQEQEQEEEISRYLDALEEQTGEEEPDGMEWRKEEEEVKQQDWSNVVHVDSCDEGAMSDGLSRIPAYSQYHVDGRQGDSRSARHAVSGGAMVRSMVEVKSSGIPGKMIDAARMKGYRG